MDEVAALLAMLGALVLQERLDKDPEWHAVLGVGGLALALFGAVMIASAEEKEGRGGGHRSAVALLTLVRDRVP